MVACYVDTAALAVGIVTVYCFTAYHSGFDPFRHQDGEEVNEHTVS